MAARLPSSARTISKRRGKGARSVRRLSQYAAASADAAPWQQPRSIRPAQVIGTRLGLGCGQRLAQPRGAARYTPLRIDGQRVIMNLDGPRDLSRLFMEFAAQPTDPGLLPHLTSAGGDGWAPCDLPIAIHKPSNPPPGNHRVGQMPPKTRTTIASALSQLEGFQARTRRLRRPQTNPPCPR